MIYEGHIQQHSNVAPQTHSHTSKQGLFGPRNGLVNSCQQWGKTKKNVVGGDATVYCWDFEFGGYFLDRFFFSDRLNCIFCHLFLPLSERPDLEADLAELFPSEMTAISTSSANEGRDLTINRRMWREARR